MIQFTTLVSRASLTSGELIRACIEGGDEAVWEEFVRRFRPAIVITVSRTARRFGEWTPQLVDDSLETFLKLRQSLPHLTGVHTAGRESIVGLLKSVAFSVTHDHFSQRHGRHARRR